MYKGKRCFHKGEMIVEHTFSDTLMLALLRANDPARFKERSIVEQVWVGDITKLNPAQLEKLIGQLEEECAAGDVQRLEELRRERLLLTDEGSK